MDLIHINKKTLDTINPRVKADTLRSQTEAGHVSTKPAYFLTVVEQMTGYGLVAFSPAKSVSMIRRKLVKILRRMQAALGAPVLSMSSDHGKEFSFGITKLLNQWDPPIKQRLVQRASRVEKYNSDFQRSFYRLVRLKRGGLKACADQAEKLTNNLLSKNIKLTPAEAVQKTDAEISPAYKLSREGRKPYRIKKPVRIGECRYLVKMRKNIRDLGYKTYKGNHFSTRLFTVRNITNWKQLSSLEETLRTRKPTPNRDQNTQAVAGLKAQIAGMRQKSRYYVNKQWRDRDEIMIVSGTDDITDQTLQNRAY